MENSTLNGSSTKGVMSHGSNYLENNETGDYPQTDPAPINTYRPELNWWQIVFEVSTEG